MLLSFHAMQHAGCSGSIWCMVNLSPVQLLSVWLVLVPPDLLGNRLERLVALGCVVCICGMRGWGSDVMWERGSKIGSRSSVWRKYDQREFSHGLVWWTYRQSSSWPVYIELGFVRIERDDRRSSQFDESRKAREWIRARSWRDRESRAVAVDDYNIDTHEKGRAANRKRGTSFSIVPPNIMSNSRKGSSSKHPSGIEALLIDIEKHLDRRWYPK